LKQNETILDNQKTRTEILLDLLEKVLTKSSKSVNSNNVQDIVICKVDLFNLLSEIYHTPTVPQRTDNANLQCNGFYFNSPEEDLNLADQKLILSSVVNSFSELFGSQLIIPSLSMLEKDLESRPDEIEVQKQRQARLEKNKAIREKEEHETREK
jgi:hypothetical protein